MNRKNGPPVQHLNGPQRHTVATTEDQVRTDRRHFSAFRQPTAICEMNAALVDIIGIAVRGMRGHTTSLSGHKSYMGQLTFLLDSLCHANAIHTAPMKENRCD